jgi:hypothetical protein
MGSLESRAGSLQFTVLEVGNALLELDSSKGIIKLPWHCNIIGYCQVVAAKWIRSTRIFQRYSIECVLVYFWTKCLVMLSLPAVSGCVLTLLVKIQRIRMGYCVSGQPFGVTLLRLACK